MNDKESGTNLTVRKKDFVEIKYTGYSNGQIFDSNVEEDVKKLNPKAEAHKTIIVVGEKMVVSGLDIALEEKEVGKDYEIELNPEEAFGKRNKDLVKTMPLKIFREKNMNPQPGMVFAMDNNLAKILAVSGARVTVDFNNPLAGKPVKYKFSIIRKVDDENEKARTLFELMFRFVPDFEIKDKVFVKGSKGFEVFVNAFSGKFKELMGKELGFELKEEKKDAEVDKVVSDEN